VNQEAPANGPSIMIIFLGSLALPSESNHPLKTEL
jgi:hypothetical protein